MASATGKACFRNGQLQFRGDLKLLAQPETVAASTDSIGSAETYCLMLKRFLAGLGGRLFFTYDSGLLRPRNCFCQLNLIDGVADEDCEIGGIDAPIM